MEAAAYGTEIAGATLDPGGHTEMLAPRKPDGSPLAIITYWNREFRPKIGLSLAWMHRSTAWLHPSSPSPTVRAPSIRARMSDWHAICS